MTAKPGRDTACPVTRDLRLRSVGIQQANTKVGIGSGQHPLDAIGPNTGVAVAYAARECMNVGGSVREIDDQKIIAAGDRLEERNAGHISCAARIVAKRCSSGVWAHFDSAVFGLYTVQLD